MGIGTTSLLENLWDAFCWETIYWGAIYLAILCLLGHYVLVLGHYVLGYVLLLGHYKISTVWLNPGTSVAPTRSGAHFSRSCNNHFWLQVGSLKGAGSACDENEIGTWIPVLTVNTHRGLPYGPFARLRDMCPVDTDKGRTHTSFARRSPSDTQCASAGPRSTRPCHRPGELGGELRAARDSLTAQTRPAPWVRGQTPRSPHGDAAQHAWQRGGGVEKHRG